MHLYPINGAVHDVGRGRHGLRATATRRWAEVIVGVDPDPAKAAELIALGPHYWDAIHPYSAAGPTSTS